jgi:hypothetical protein
MSLRSLESAITAEARRHFNNPKLRVKDLMEWSTAEIKPREGEVVGKLPLNRVWVAIKVEHDKRKDSAGDGA